VLPIVAVLYVVLLGTAFAARGGHVDPAGSALGDRGWAEGRDAARVAPAGALTTTPPPRPPGGGWSGYAFDACRAPSQRVMDRWLHTSPFVGVGIYLGGIHRACEQKHLSPGWVARQKRAGWQLLPIWVGPQAACTGYAHRIDGRPGQGYRAAAEDGARQARLAATAARRLGLGGGETLWYDIEPFPTDRRTCRESSLVFLDAWTRSLHRQGFRSGVYSHAKAGIALLSRAPRRYAQPDAVWFAWVGGAAGALPREHVADPAWMSTSRVHQFHLDTRVRFGGIAMDIDWNYVSLAGSPKPSACGRSADQLRHRPLVEGVAGREVGVAQCLLDTVDHHDAPADGVFGPRTRWAVAAYQADRGLRRTGRVDRRTWTALLSEGHRPVLKKGARGEPVRRLQRALNAALAKDIAVDGHFGSQTQAAVRRYQARIGRARTGAVTRRVWASLGRGEVGTPPPPAKQKRADRPNGSKGSKGKGESRKGKAGKPKSGNSQRKPKRDKERDRDTDEEPVELRVRFGR